MIKLISKFIRAYRFVLPYRMTTNLISSIENKYSICMRVSWLIKMTFPGFDLEDENVFVIEQK